MGKFTILKDPRVDKKIQLKLDYIVDEILKVIEESDVKAIVLVGSFGRGEGGVFITDNAVVPVNDFDILIFPKTNVNEFKKKYLSNLHDIAAKCAKMISIKQIDISVGDKRKFSIRQFSLFYTVNTYEIVRGHYILFGSIDLAKMKKAYVHQKIPLMEGLKYLFTRGSGLLIPLYAQQLKRKIPIDFSYMELNKARLAMGDSYLIQNKKYHFSYTKRIERAENLKFDDLPNGAIIKAMYINALKWKLKPVSIDDDYDINGEITSVVKIFVEYFLFFESYRLKKKFKNILEYLQITASMKRPLIYHITKSDSFVEKLKIMMLLISTFCVEEDVESKMLKEAVRRLRYFDESKFEISWLSCVAKYLNIWHPEGIVKELVK